ncbi:hypothetical protein [Mycobacterium sp. OAE908]|uniref:hypothetical protein n=1 Tax=Mycobacterium sp. OAE908 TaxID=2817899 RepID=UPI001AE22BB0
MKPTDCPRQCDCHHPSECIFNRAPERPSYAVVWIVGAVMVAVAVALLTLVLL